MICTINIMAPVWTTYISHDKESVGWSLVVRGLLETHLYTCRCIYIGYLAISSTLMVPILEGFSSLKGLLKYKSHILYCVLIEQIFKVHVWCTFTTSGRNNLNQSSLMWLWIVNSQFDDLSHTHITAITCVNVLLSRIAKPGFVSYAPCPLKFFVASGTPLLWYMYLTNCSLMKRSGASQNN